MVKVKLIKLWIEIKLFQCMYKILDLDPFSAVVFSFCHHQASLSDKAAWPLWLKDTTPTTEDDSCQAATCPSNWTDNKYIKHLKPAHDSSAQTQAIDVFMQSDFLHFC